MKHLPRSSAVPLALTVGGCSTVAKLCELTVDGIERNRIAFRPEPQKQGREPNNQPFT